MGDPVQAMDGDDQSRVRYSLSGLDERFFKIASTTGQIMIGGESGDEKTDPELNYEKAPNSYTVEVTARDGDGNMDAVTVTIMVTDVNEPPMFAEGSDATPEYDENGTAAVITYTATDPEGAGIDWDVTGIDAGRFTISGGVLSFKKSPDFEMPGDTGHDAAIPAFDNNGDGDVLDPDELEIPIAADPNNMYQIMVRATEQRAQGDMGPAKTSMIRVTVDVQNVNEPGVAKLTLRQPEVLTAITASVTDPDTTAALSETWAWDVSKVQNPDISEDQTTGKMLRGRMTQPHIHHRTIRPWTSSCARRRPTLLAPIPV